MFSRSFRLGSLFGFPIHVNLTFLILLGVVGLTMGGGSALGAATAIAVVLLSFASVVLHELGHALVARHLGVNVSRIELHFFGGAAQMTDQPRSARDEIAIAAAGPAVSFALAGVSLVLAQLSGLGLFALLAWINLVLGAFNLVPALPMDGGRILRAVLSRRMGFLRATEASVQVARVFTVALGVYGLAAHHYYLALLAVLLWLMSSAELMGARRLRGYAGEPDLPEVEVLDPRTREPRDRFAGPTEHRPARSSGFWPPTPGRAGGFVIRREGHRLVIERLD
ncbi:MAG TPA: site-2 protease family protein [Kofleriaceae bacterium]|nr:site-2 protease family protein [Kofleriaceae bacterium]